MVFRVTFRNESQYFGWIDIRGWSKLNFSCLLETHVSLWSLRLEEETAEIHARVEGEYFLEEQIIERGQKQSMIRIEADLEKCTDYKYTM